MLNSYKDRLFDILLLITILVFIIYTNYNNEKLTERLRYLAFDSYNKLFPRKPAKSLYPQHKIAGVAIIDIDEASLQKEGQWPWSRDKLAKMVENLNKFGAKVIAFDMVFAEKDRTSPATIFANLPVDKKDKIIPEIAMIDNDKIFADAIKQAKNVVTGFVGATQATLHYPLLKAKLFDRPHISKQDKNAIYKSDPRPFVTKQEFFATNLRIFSKAAAGNGAFTAIPEKDGIIRYVPLILGQKNAEGKIILYPSLSIEAIRVAIGDYAIETTSYLYPTPEGYGITNIHLGTTPKFIRDKKTGKRKKIYGRYDIPTDKHGRIAVYYSGHKKERYIPAWQILKGEVKEEKIKDKIILIGTSSIGLLDLRSSPLNPVLPGVEIHAEIIEQILSGTYLNRPSFFKIAEIAVIISAALLIILLLPFIGTLTLATLSFLILAGVWFFSIKYYVDYGYLLDPVYPTLAILGFFIVAAVTTSFRQESEKKFYRQAFGHYVSEELMNEIMTSPDKLSLGGTSKELTVMFTDVRNFTSISETMTPEQLIRMMNDFLTPMTSVIMEHQGTIDKYMGDAIMAFWNAPVDVKDHPRKACKVALLMADILIPLNEKLKQQAKEEGRKFYPIKNGIGIVTGECSVGNMGSKQRFAYSALGDAVNLASRLEGQTKIYGVDNLISETTASYVEDFAILELDLLTVKGRQMPERIYTIIGNENYAQTDEFKNWQKLHKKMLELYRGQNFKEALNLIQEKILPIIDKKYQDLYKLYIDRIEFYIKESPPADWQGIWVATSK